MDRILCWCKDDRLGYNQSDCHEDSWLYHFFFVAIYLGCLYLKSR